MDLGIAGRKAIVCASSRGLGKACAMSLASNGVDGWMRPSKLRPLVMTVAWPPLPPRRGGVTDGCVGRVVGGGGA